MNLSEGILAFGMTSRRMKTSKRSMAEIEQKIVQNLAWGTHLSTFQGSYFGKLLFGFFFLLKWASFCPWQISVTYTLQKKKKSQPQFSALIHLTFPIWKCDTKFVEHFTRKSTLNKVGETACIDFKVSIIAFPTVELQRMNIERRWSKASKLCETLKGRI